MSKWIVAPIALAGLGYAMAIGYAVRHQYWDVAAMLFCYGLAMLGARIAQLINRRSNNHPPVSYWWSWMGRGSDGSETSTNM